MVKPTHGRELKSRRILVVIVQGRRPLGKYGRSWKDNIKMDLRGTARGGTLWNVYHRLESSGEVL
jgi:hypothetical protein